MLIRRIITSDLCTAVGCHQFRKNQENFRGELWLNVVTPFTIIVVVLQLRDVPKTVIYVNQNGGHGPMTNTVMASELEVLQWPRRGYDGLLLSLLWLLHVLASGTAK